ncbi:PAAR domain-containing protein [Pseudomonas aeruginosa]|uniref:PAAR domain-containing protein n=1 Tax=Pseudomonas aeruginosa TaxID=287 RepID=UPI0015C524B3|nr:PAAR domain-containing protein [Pseudomonas aeruginosa]
MARGAIRLGDGHSGGGRMIEASGMLVNGRRQCLLGDKAECLLHAGIFPLVSGGEGSAQHDRRPMVFEPAHLACGCQVFSSCAAACSRS